MIEANVIIKTNSGLNYRTLYIYKTDYPDGADFYELVAYKLGWDGYDDALWFLSSKNVILLERGN